MTSKGSDPDTLVASAKAYLGALNKIVMKHQRDMRRRRRAEGDSRHSGARVARTRNPSGRITSCKMDSGLDAAHRPGMTSVRRVGKGALAPCPPSIIDLAA